MSAPSFRLDGATAIVTGAGSGIGAAIALGLAQFGADVGCLDLTLDRVEATVRAIQAEGRNAIPLAADTSAPGAVDACVERLEAALGPLRLAVNCAGVYSSAPAEDMGAAVPGVGGKKR